MSAQEGHATATPGTPSSSSLVDAREPVAVAGDVRMNEERRCDDEPEEPLDTQAELPLLVTTASSSLAPTVVVDAGAMTSGTGDSGDAFLTDALLFSLEEDAELLVLEGVNAAIDLSDLDFSDIGGFRNGEVVLQGEHESECLVDVSAGEIGQFPSSAQVKPSKPPSEMKTNSIPSEPQPPSRVRKPRVIKPAGPVVARPACPAGTQVGDTRTTGRKRAKDELEYLRQHVNDLEEQLQQLRPRSPHLEKQEQPPSQLQQLTYNDENNSVSAVLSLVSSNSSSSLSSGSSLWKRVASHQMDERRKAEAENARLRDLLEAQLRLARSLARTLRKRPNLTVRPLYFSESRCHFSHRV